MPELRVGISGWTYAGWRGDFYPEGLQHRRELEYASRKLNSIEINGSFYSLQRPASYQKWVEETPDDFLFSIKGSRYITHMRRLRDVRIPLANFFASGVFLLAEKMGPFLWQFPANFAYEPERIAAYLELLPKTTFEAAALAEEHTLTRPGGAWTDPLKNRPLRHAFEPRNPGWYVPEFMSLLRRHGAALVIADSAGFFPYAEDVTADFVYLRLHGAETLYAGSYSDEKLDRWAERIRAWRAGNEPADPQKVSDEPPPTAGARDAFVYFDNDVKARAPFDAMRLMARLAEAPGVTPQPRRPHAPQDQPRAS